MRFPFSRPRRRTLLLLATAAFLAAFAGGILGVGLQFDLPDVSGLEDYTPPLSTRVLARDGTVLATFAEQRRMLLTYREIPKAFELALLAVEDSSFYRHSGIDFRGILRALWHDLTTLSFEQGASTLTQQLARNLFPDIVNPSQKTLRRKFQEALLALEIERHYSKQEILQLYCNQVYMGHGRYGLEAASRFFFGKPARDLTLPEAALLAGVIQRPESLSPIRNPDRALRRRNHVLSRMIQEGFLREPSARSASEAPLQITPSYENAALAPYFVEEIRRSLQARYGDEALYRSGLEARSTLDPGLQSLANEAVERGLRDLDKRQGWRGAPSRVPSGQSADEFEPPSWRRSFRAGDVTDAVVVSVSQARAKVRIGDREAWLGPEEIAWTGRRYASALLKRGDVVRVRLEDDQGGTWQRAVLEQEPRVEGALVAIEPSTGAIRALVGGYDFARSEFDRAVQARRQCGSAFKPFVYAAALSSGLTLADTILDEPTVFLDPTGPAPYQPENYGKDYHGTLTLRRSLEKSANIATVKLLDRIGFEPVLGIARRLGISTDLRPYPSLALGAFEVSLLEITSAYGTFANQGVRAEPHLLEEVLANDGDVLDRTRPEIRDAVSPQIAYLMTRVMEGVVTDGTGAAARELGRPLAGKTGTSDEFIDAWFVGYAPDLVVGVWVGFDEKRSLGARETGAQAALPIWKAFMEEAYRGRPPEEFPVPPGVSIVVIDADTGLRVSEAAGCRPVLPEAFLEGSEPVRHCSAAEHARLRLPYPFQRFSVDDDGALVVPEGEFRALLAEEPSVRLASRSDALEWDTAGGRITLSIRLVADEETPGTSPALPPEEAPPGGFRGTDGRIARLRVVKR